MSTPSKPIPSDDVPSTPGDAHFVDVSELVKQGQGLVRSIALSVHRALPVPTDLDDLIAYGQLGLVEAAQTFESESRVRFTTFAYYRVRGAIYDGVAKMTWTSRARFRRLRFQAMADEVLENERSDADSRQSIEQDVNWLGRVTEQLAVVFLATSEDDGVSRSISEAADPSDSPCKMVASREMQESLRKLVDQLPLESKRLINSIYFEGYTLTQAAQRAGISKSWASRIHAKSLDQLAKSLRSMGE